MVTIRIDGLNAAYGARTVLRDVTTRFEAGTLTGVIGPNGAGKSTLARAILALLPVQGRVLVDEREVAALPRAVLARQLAYLPQGQTLHWPLSVERLAALGRLPHLGPMSRIGSEDLAAVERALQRTDLLALRDRVATELSGGERSRALLARALAVEAPALIADEPLANLDPGHQIEVMDVLKAEAGAGATVIVVLHDLTVAARYCDRLVLLRDGEKVAEGAPATVLTTEVLRAVYGVEAEVRLDEGHASITILERSKAPGRLARASQAR